jgi:hypothetical protein
MRILPIVTTDIEEYARLTGRTNSRVQSGYETGLYFNGVIWVKSLNPKSLFHEYIHHIIGHEDDPKYVSVELYKCFLHTLWDVFYFRLTRFRVSKEQKIEV